MIQKKSLSTALFIPNSNPDDLPHGIDETEFSKLSKSTILVELDNKIFMYHKAIAQLIKIVPRPYSFFYYFLNFPPLSPLFRVIYMIVARFRPQISKMLKLSSCKL